MGLTTKLQVELTAYGNQAGTGNPLPMSSPGLPGVMIAKCHQAILNHLDPMMSIVQNNVVDSGGIHIVIKGTTTFVKDLEQVNSNICIYSHSLLDNVNKKYHYIL